MGSEMCIRDRVKEVLVASPSKRKYVLQTNGALKTLCRDAGLGTGGNKGDLIDRLLSHESKTSEGTAGDVADEDDSAFDPVFHQIVKQSFMVRQENQNDRSAAKQGHENEPKHLKSFLRLCQQGKCAPLSIMALYWPGMIRKSSKHYVKSTVDGLAIATIN